MVKFLAEGDGGDLERARRSAARGAFDDAVGAIVRQRSVSQKTHMCMDRTLFAVSLSCRHECKCQSTLSAVEERVHRVSTLDEQPQAEQGAKK